MSIWIQWTAEQETMWEQWLSEKPQCIRDMVKKYGLRPDRLYTVKSTGHKVTIYSLHEDNTVTINVLYRFNKDVMITPLQERRVFGINPSDLEECDWNGEVEDGQKCLDEEHQDERVPDPEEARRILDRINAQIQSEYATKH